MRQQLSTSALLDALIKAVKAKMAPENFYTCYFNSVGQVERAKCRDLLKLIYELNPPNTTEPVDPQRSCKPSEHVPR